MGPARYSHGIFQMRQMASRRNYGSNQLPLSLLLPKCLSWELSSSCRYPGFCLHSSFISSGPVSLPVILLVLAKGQRINTVFPLSIAGPAILQLVHVSALAFENAADKNTNYAFFEASTISGILHASLYLDAVVLPYYTGFDALVTSRFSGECISCVCRKEALVAGGKLVSYRGRSVTTFLVVGSICMRIICRVSGEKGRGIIFCRFLLEGLAWIFMIKDCLYLTTSSPPEQTALRAATLGAILLLICLYLLIKTCSLLTNWFTWSTT